jgi:putative DNA primase/helicase
MTGHELEKMLLLYGEGLNGKSVTLEVIESLLGSVNVSYLSLSDLTNDDVKRAGIEGKMLNISHESGKDVNPNVLKQLTSGERVLIKHLYRDPRETNSYGKLIAAFNILPRAENTFGFFRRLLILAYQVTIPKEEIDRQLASKLKGELPGILLWVLKALPALMTRREFSPCESSEKALEQYRLQSDNVRLFLSEACETSEYTTQASELYTAYRNYCIGSSLKPIGKNKFYERLECLGYDRVMYANTLYYKLKVTEQ